ncbi:MAG: NifB/NifX family molybdenum-iron cluster-binding protein [Nanoarchaeota archaeon]|nr:NifB/NifX family molybdenum-iron cluster-binding protein [Nanoarchaeota archaeon]
MKIAISCQEDNIKSMVDQRFGRCKYFLIVDVDNNKVIKTEAVLNQGAQQGHGAGIRAAEQVGELGVTVVVTGDLGPNATNVLGKLGIKSYHASGKAEDVVNDFINNQLKEINEVSEPHPENKEPKIESGERIFFPLLDDDGENSKISEHFGHAPFFGLYDVETKELKIIKNDLDHTDPNKSPIDQIEEAVNPTTIFAKGIGGRAIGIIAQKGLKLKTGNYPTVKDVLDNLDKLDEQTQSCGHEH